MMIISPKKDPLKPTTVNITPHQLVPNLLSSSNTPGREMRTVPKETVREKQHLVSSISEVMYLSMKSEHEKDMGNLHNVFQKDGLGEVVSAGDPTRSIHGVKNHMNVAQMTLGMIVRGSLVDLHDLYKVVWPVLGKV